VRAAAARVIHLSGSAWLLPDLVAALSHEADTAAAIEEIRAIGSLGDASMDAALVAAATRLQTPIVDVVAATLGRMRGADAFVHLPALRSAGLSDTGYAYLARMAVRKVVRWRYTPTLLDGEPVPVIMTVTVNFRRSP